MSVQKPSHQPIFESKKQKKNIGKILEKRRNGKKHFKTFYLSNSLKQRQSQFMNALINCKKTAKLSQFEQKDVTPLNIEGKQKKIRIPKIETTLVHQRRNFDDQKIKKINRHRAIRQAFSSQLQGNEIVIESWQNGNGQQINEQAQNDLFEYKENFNSSKTEKSQFHEINESYTKEEREQKKDAKNFLNFTARTAHKKMSSSDTLISPTYFKFRSKKQSRHSESLKFKSNLITPAHKTIKSTVRSSNQEIQEKDHVSQLTFSAQKSQNDFLSSYTKNTQIQIQSTYRKYQSSLDKCRMMTQSYDELKQQIITKIKIKKSSGNQEASGLFPLHNYKKTYRVGNNLLKEKENRLHLHRNSNFTTSYSEKNKNQRGENLQRITRYADISVAEFLDKDDASCIDHQLMRKIKELKRQSHRPRSKTE